MVGVEDGLEGAYTGVERTYSDRFLFYRVLAVDSVSIGDAEVVFSGPGALELAVHEDGTSPLGLATPEDGLGHVGQLQNNGVLGLRYPTFTQVEGLALLPHLAPVAHVKGGEVLILQLGEVPLQGGAELLEGVVADVEADLVEPGVVDHGL